MNQDRSFGISESWIGLSLLIFLLLAIGFFLLQQLVATSERPSVEFRAGFHSQPALAAGEPQFYDEQQPQVLTIENSETGTPIAHTPQRAESITDTRSGEIRSSGSTTDSERR
jgi:hypothetical protein